MTGDTSKGSGKAAAPTSRARKLAPLTEQEIRALVMQICEDDPTRAGALLILLTDANERQSSGAAKSFPFWAARQAAFSQLGNDVIDAQVELLRSL